MPHITTEGPSFHAPTRGSSQDLMRSCTTTMIYTQGLGSGFEASMLHYIDFELVWSLECVFVGFFDLTLWFNGWFKHRFLKSQSDWHNNPSLWTCFVEIRYVLVFKRKFAFLFLQVKRMGKGEWGINRGYVDMPASLSRRREWQKDELCSYMSTFYTAKTPLSRITRLIRWLENPINKFR